MIVRPIKLTIVMNSSTVFACPPMMVAACIQEMTITELPVMLTRSSPREVFVVAHKANMAQERTPKSSYKLCYGSVQHCSLVIVNVHHVLWQIYQYMLLQAL